MSIDVNKLEQIIRAAGEIALGYFNDLNTLAINKKSARDLVTDADVAVENYLKSELGKHWPDYGFWGEESGQSANQNNRWIVDPIDGTHSFSKGQYFWSISVALEIAGELQFGAVYAPALNDYYHAVKDQGSWKNGRAIQVSAETSLANSMIATGFACLRN